MDLFSLPILHGHLSPPGAVGPVAPALIWTAIAADAVIAAVCCAIPVGLFTFTRRLRLTALYLPALLLGLLLLALGVAQFADIWLRWQPAYPLLVVAKAVTAMLALSFLVTWRRQRTALARMPSMARIQSLISRLEAEQARRSRVEEQLADTRRELAVILASIDAGLITTDASGRVVQMNEVAQRITGWSQAGARGRIVWEVFVREDAQTGKGASNPFETMLDQGLTLYTPQRLIALGRDGSRSLLEVKASLTRHDDDSVHGMTLVLRDLSRLNSTETELHRLAAIVESSNDAIIGKTLDGRITNWNRAAQAIFGYSAEQAIGQSIQMLIPTDRETEEMRILADIARGVTVPPFDTIRQRRDGSRVEVSVTISPIRDGMGRIVGASKIARDISRHRQVEAALRENQARLRFALEVAQIGDWDLDLSTGEVSRSIRHDRCFGYQQLQAHWDFATFLRHVVPSRRDDVSRSFRLACRELRDWQVSCPITWPDGSPHWINVQGSILREAGRPLRMLGIVIDITEARQAEEMRLNAQRLEAQNQQILEANRIKSQFLANMSHELRTPLNAIIGFADLLHRGVVPRDSIKHEQFLGHIATSGRHLLQLINDVLDLAKVESGKLDFLPEPVDLAALVAEVRDILLIATQEKRIRLSVDIDPSLSGLVLDPGRLRQVLYNYLSNAIKFSAEGGEVVVRAAPEGEGRFRLEVQDQGIGIAPEDLSRLFVEFQQLESGYSRHHQGTGLGLALTRRLVQAQGGQVGVRSTLGEGSVFYAVLDRVPRIEQVPVASDRGDTEAHRLLVIDPDEKVQRLATARLREAGFQVDAVGTGELALARAAATRYDAITLALKLPEQGGLGVLAGIRRDGPSSESPVVGVSMPDPAGSRAAFAITNVLSKPIQNPEIGAAMARLSRPEHRRLRVMVIDDEPLALELMQATLASLSIDAICRLDARSALEELDQQRPDALILDLMMPHFDGFQTLDALRRLNTWQALPVFIWTSMILNDEEYASLARSASAIISKGGGELLAMLDRLSHWRPEPVTPSAPAPAPR